MYGQGLGTGPDTSHAAFTAASQAAEALGTAQARSVIVFSTDQHDGAAVMGEVRKVFPEAHVVGARTAGVFAGTTVSYDGVAVLASDSLRLFPAHAGSVSASGEAAGSQAAGWAVDSLEAAGAVLESIHSGLLLISDGILGSSAAVARGVAQEVGPATRVIGGGAGDGMKFVETVQYSGDSVRSDAVVATAFTAPGPVGIALRHGCDAIGEPMVTTSVAGQMLSQLDYRNSFARYREVAAAALGSELDLSGENFTQFAMLHPVGISMGEGDRHVLRSPLAVSEDGAIMCCSEVPANAVLRVMEGSDEKMLEATKEAARIACAELGDGAPQAILVFACVSRDFVLGNGGTDGESRELAAVRAVAGEGMPVVGGLTFGSYGTFGSGLVQYHSKSVAIAAFGG